MSVRSVLSRWLPLALSEKVGLTRSFIPNEPWMYWGFRRDQNILGEEAYNKVGWVYGCVRAISRNVQQIPVYAVQQSNRNKGRVDRLPDMHPFSQLLLNPNEEEDMAAILESSATHLSLRGEAFWELDGVLPGANGKPRPARIYSRPPQWLWKVDITNDRYSTFHLRLPMLGTLIDIPGDNGVFFKYYNPRDPWRGLAPMAAAYQAADTYYAAQLFNSNCFNNGGAPGMVVSFDKDSPVKTLTPDHRKRLREEARALYAGINNARNVMVLGPGEKLDPIGIAMKDMDFANLMEFEKAEIMAVFGVPPIVLGDVEDANRANSDNQRRMFWEETIIPIIEDISSLVNRKIAPQFGTGILAQFDYSQVPGMRKDLESLGKGVIPWVEAGLIKINEARQTYLNLQPVPWGEEWWHAQTDVGTDGPYEVPAMPPPQDSGDAGAKISPEAARKMVAEWKNATLSRIRDGASSPLEAFPPAREAKKASRKFGVPAKLSWELAKAVHTELSVFWNALRPEDGAAELFDKTMERIPRGQSEREGAELVLESNQ